MMRWKRWVGGRAAVFGLAAILSTWLVSPPSLLAADHTVEIQDFAFVPDQLTVALGDTVTWINRDIAPHTATSTDKTWDTKTLKTGEMFTVTVTADMTTEYFCRFHPHMKATLVLNSDP